MIVYLAQPHSKIAHRRRRCLLLVNRPSWVAPPIEKEAVLDLRTSAIGPHWVTIKVVHGNARTVKDRRVRLCSRCDW